MDKVTEWRKDFPSFHDEVELLMTNDTTQSIEKIKYRFYSKPEFNERLQRPVLYILDAHHLFVNSRALVCGRGIDARGITKQAWLDVAKSKQTPLSVPMVMDLIDKQSNALAQTTYSLEVEQLMISLGYPQEATFCRYMRRWYEAEDEPSIPASERLQRRLDLRKFLLEGVNFFKFPPYGSHVRGVPLVMFEGLLTNIDRRIQLHALVPGSSYNVRAPTSLDSENFFSEFQAMDPKGTGVLFADEIPKAMENASFLLNSRVNPDR